jgi:hypothetical protein
MDWCDAGAPSERIYLARRLRLGSVSVWVGVSFGVSVGVLVGVGVSVVVGVSVGVSVGVVVVVSVGVGVSVEVSVGVVVVVGVSVGVVVVVSVGVVVVVYLPVTSVPGSNGAAMLDKACRAHVTLHTIAKFAARMNIARLITLRRVDSVYSVRRIGIDAVSDRLNSLLGLLAAVNARPRRQCYELLVCQCERQLPLTGPLLSLVESNPLSEYRHTLRRN